MGNEWAQKKVTLGSRPRGCHVITSELYSQVPDILEFEMGIVNIWSTSLLHVLNIGGFCC
jgi:hypothetical protein